MTEHMELASQVVAWLTHYVTSGAGKFVEGEAANSLRDLWMTIKTKLHGSAAKEALEDFEQKPDDVDNQAALRKQIRKAIEGDPNLKQRLFKLAERISSHTEHIKITDSDLSLGGQGGRAPAAGGGGGGAMGLDAIGGRGGPGGRMFFYGQPGVAPGAGGGGAGAIGEGVTASEGGGGGERVVGFFRAEDLPSTIRINVGRAGRGGEEGEDGEDGEDTSFGHLLHAQGGIGGRAGKVRPVARQVTRVDLDNGLRVLVLSLAECVHIRDGLLYLLSAGWDFYDVPRLPRDLRWPLACTIAAGCLDHHTQLALSAVVVDPDGNKVSEEEFFITNSTTSDIATRHAAVLLRFTATCPGTWTIMIVSGGIELARLPIAMRLSGY